MASQTRSPAQIDNAGDGDVAWDDPSRAGESDDSYASCEVSAEGATPLSEYLQATDFGFSIPGGSTINGIEVSIEMSGSGDGTVIDESVLIVGNPGGTTRMDQATGQTFGIFKGEPDEQVFTFGSPSTMWITPGVWVPSDINDAAFGVKLRVEETFNSATSLCDHISITVYYTEPTPVPDAIAAWARGSNILIQPGDFR